MRYYARNGDEITMEQWASLLGDKEYKIVAQTIVGEYAVSTVWLGLDHRFGRGVPVIFETMVFPNEAFVPGYEPPVDEDEEARSERRSRQFTDVETHRYSTEIEALTGHADVVTVVRMLHEDAQIPQDLLDQFEDGQ